VSEIYENIARRNNDYEELIASDLPWKEIIQYLRSLDPANSSFCERRGITLLILRDPNQDNHILRLELNSSNSVKVNYARKAGTADYDAGGFIEKSIDRILSFLFKRIVSTAK
jgi:hypothetical protein